MKTENYKYDPLKVTSIKYPENIAVRNHSKDLSYKKLNHECKTIAASLKSKGIDRSHRVVIFISDPLKFIKIVLALWKFGGVAVPLNPQLTNTEIESHLLIVNPDAIIIERHDDEKTFFVSANVIYYDELLIENSSLEGIKIDYDQILLLMFTSGSTGKPKCVKLSLQNLFAAYLSLTEKINLSSADKWLLSLPYFHIGGFSIIVRAIFSGGGIIIPDNIKTDSIQKKIFNEGVTHFSMVAAMFKKILDRNLSAPDSLKHLFLGGGVVPQELREKALKLNWPIEIVYGSTETSAMISVLSKEEIIDKPNSAGKILPFINVRVENIGTDDNFEEKAGGIIVRGNQVAEGYFNNDSDRFKNKDYSTGDIGYIDEDGYLFIIGRTDDIIISGGKKIDPKEIEDCLLAIPEIEDCAVFDVPSDIWGSEVCAAIVCKDKGGLENDKLLSLLKKPLSSYKIPKNIYWVNEIPRTDLGKLNRSLLDKKLFG